MTVVSAVTCPVCGSLCDDIELTIDDGKIVKVKNGCAMCEAKFLCHHSEDRLLSPLIRKNGKLGLIIRVSAGFAGRPNWLLTPQPPAATA